MKSSQSGQALVELILLMAIFVGLATFVIKEVKEREFLSNLVSGPWKHLDGLVSNGHWSERNKSNQFHPGLFGRRVSLKGTEHRK